MTTLPALYPKETAIVLRRVLRAAFPSTTFRIRTARGSMVSSVNVSWVDGPTVARVEEITGGFVAGRFDGMTDSYNTDRSKFLEVEGTSYRPGCDYIMTDRTISATLANRCIAQIAAYFGVTEIPVAEPSGKGHVVGGGMGWRNVTPLANVDWAVAIHRAAYDRTTYAAGVSA